MYPITSISASILSLFYIFLAIKVVSLRRFHKVSVGSNGNHRLEMAVRAHGNFSEYVPFALILCLCAELNHIRYFIGLSLMMSFILGRLIHAYVFLHNPRKLKLRALAMILTFISLIGFSIAILYLTL